MNQYLIPPEDCFIVRTFKVASSLRNAADILNCDPAGLLRKVHRIAEDYDLLVKVKGRWVLTPKGHAIASWVEGTLLSQQQALNSKIPLRIGTTTWYSEQLVVPALNRLKKILPELGELQILTPRQSEAALLSHEIDFNIACYTPQDPLIAYKKVVKEKWAVIAPIAWQYDLKKLNRKETFEFLCQKTFIRHQELNPNYVLPHCISPIVNFLVIDHLVGVRAGLISGLGWSCVPEMLLKNPQFQQQVLRLDLETHLQHELCISWLRNRSDIKELAGKMTTWLQAEC